MTRVEEVSLLSLFFVAAFVIKEELKDMRIPNLALPIFLVLIGGALLRIGLTATVYQERQERITAISDEADRTIIQYEEASHNWMLEYWASPYESLILSTLDGSSKTFVLHLSPNTFKSSKKEDHFLTYFKDYPYDTINNRYFNLLKVSYKLEEANQ